MLEGRQKHRLWSHTQSLLPWDSPLPVHLPWAEETENPLGLPQHCRTLTALTAPAMASTEQQGKTPRSCWGDGTMLASAAATSGLLWGRSASLGWPTKTPHINGPVLWTSGPCAWEMVVPKVQLMEGLMKVRKAQCGGDLVSHWGVWDITCSTLQFSPVFPFPLLLAGLCGYSQLKGLTSRSSLVPLLAQSSAAHWGLPWMHRTQQSSGHYKTSPWHIWIS